MTSPLTQDQSNAYDYLRSLLDSWGLSQLTGDALRLIQEGHDQTNIPSLLQDTQAYKDRFAGNEVRKKNGLAVLSPSEYLQTERSYRQILSSNGMPSGFYDQPSDFADWIGKDVSPTEINQRVSYAVQAANRADPGTKQALMDYYGVDSAHLASFFLDQSRAQPLIDKQAKAAQIGAAALNNGISFDRNTAEALSQSQLVQSSQYDQAVGNVADMARRGTQLAGMHGGQYDANAAAQEVFFGDSAAGQKRKNLSDQEKAAFSGNGGVVAKTSLSQGANGY